MTQPEQVEVTQAAERLLDAIEDANSEYSIRLTRLVDDEAEYTLTNRGKTSIHASHADAYAERQKRDRADKISAALVFLASAQPEGVVPSGMQHVAYYDEGEFHWMSGIAPRDCELYAVRKAAASPTPPALLRADAGEVAIVERVETVPIDYPISDEETPPIWRVLVGEYCADFDYEQAARNFAGAINAALTARQDAASDAGVERLREALEQIAGYSEHNGMTRRRMRAIATKALTTPKPEASPDTHAELVEGLQNLIQNLEHSGSDGWDTGHVHNDDVTAARALIAKHGGGK